MATLNSREYPELPETFVHDLRVELGLEGRTVLPGALPQHSERAFPQTLTLTKSVLGVGFRTEPGEQPRVVATFCYERRDGSICTMDVTVPEEVRSQLGGAQLTGDVMVTSVYEATLPQVVAAFNADWGVVP